MRGLRWPQSPGSGAARAGRRRCPATCSPAATRSSASAPPLSPHRRSRSAMRPPVALLPDSCPRARYRRHASGNGLRVRRRAGAREHPCLSTRQAGLKRLVESSYGILLRGEEPGNDVGGLFPFARFPLELCVTGPGELVIACFAIVLRNAPLSRDAALLLQ